MISYEKDPQQTIPESSVKIIGLGGAGANMLDRASLDGMTGAEMMCVNTDMRTLSRSVTGEKIQIGKNLTKGLGAGGDPELGLKAMQESEIEIRAALRGRKMIFLCVGLGGGTGSGAAPLICRVAREEGAFVVVFATMPFSFEGLRRRQQADTALNEIAVLSNALVTFDNGRMGELVLAKEGIHEAFAAADKMISDSIKAVTRLVVRPGLINVGLDDLMAALSTTRSRCLFGSGLAQGEDRSQSALENALSSPLLDKGSLLEDATTVMVHICGGDSLTLYEVELLMQGLSKHVPVGAHILFGAAVDPAMGDSLSVTIISALPEDKLNSEAKPESKKEEPRVEIIKEDEKAVEPEEPSVAREVADDEAPVPTIASGKNEATSELKEEKMNMDDDPFFANSEPENGERVAAGESERSREDEVPSNENQNSIETEKTADVEAQTPEDEELSDPQPTFVDIVKEPEEDKDLKVREDLETSRGSLSRKGRKSSQSELELDGGPKGKFEGGSPNFHEGEDLDIPPFLRKRRH